MTVDGFFIDTPYAYCARNTTILHKTERHHAQWPAGPGVATQKRPQMPIDPKTFAQWQEWSKLDTWHHHFVGSDIRQMLGEIERLCAKVNELEDSLDCAGERLMGEDI